MFCITSLLLYVVILPTLSVYVIKFVMQKLRTKLDLTNEVDISGKTVIVTGASDGIGLITAEELANRGARVIMACRNLEKAKKTVEKIRKRTRNGELIIMKLDLSSLATVREFAAEFIKKYNNNGISILINNAGVITPAGKMNLTQDGFEECFGVNHLGHFLLTNLLLPELEKAGNQFSDPSRIVIVSSTGHLSGKLTFNDLNYSKTPLNYYKCSHEFYCNSKLANNLFNLELGKRFRARQAAGEKVNVNSYALCPGLVYTNIGNNTPVESVYAFMYKHVMFPIMKLLMAVDVRQGAETTLYCALSKYLTYHSGEMYRNNQFWDYSKRIKLSAKEAELLWEKSEELVQLH